MKKIVSIFLILVLCMSMAVLTGCGKSEVLESGYEGTDFAAYITLPDYNTYTVAAPAAVEITDADVDAEIHVILDEFSKLVEVVEGVVEEGDRLVIDYNGTLADGTTQDGMNTTGATLGPVGDAGYIEGFEEGLLGVPVGETVTLELQFPDPYLNNPDLAGKDVTFVVKVRSKIVDTLPELTDAFIKENTEYKTLDAMKAGVRAKLEADAVNEQLMDLKNELYEKIYDEAVVLGYPEGKVQETVDKLEGDYKAIAETYGYSDWDQFRNDYFNMEQAEYEENLKLYAESLVKSDLIIYCMAEMEEVTLTEDEYMAELHEMMEMAGFADDAEFEEYAGMTIREYADSYQMDRDLVLTKCLDKIYDRLAKNS